MEHALRRLYPTTSFIRILVSLFSYSNISNSINCLKSLSGTAQNPLISQLHCLSSPIRRLCLSSPMGRLCLSSPMGRLCLSILNSQYKACRDELSMRLQAERLSITLLRMMLVSIGIQVAELRCSGAKSVSGTRKHLGRLCLSA